MGLKSDRWIRSMALEAGMITPFEETMVRQGVISFGLSSYGYDLRLGRILYRFRDSVEEELLDPKAFASDVLEEVKGESFVLPPHGYALGTVMEYLRMPRGVMGLAWGKSTYARLGLCVNITPIEAGWEGRLTIGLANLTSLPLKLYAGEGIAQLLFWEGDEPPTSSYADRGGKYQGTLRLTPPRIEGVDKEVQG